MQISSMPNQLLYFLFEYFSTYISCSLGVTVDHTHTDTQPNLSDVLTSNIRLGPNVNEVLSRALQPAKHCVVS